MQLFVWPLWHEGAFWLIDVPRHLDNCFDSQNTCETVAFRPVLCFSRRNSQRKGAGWGVWQQSVSQLLGRARIKYIWVAIYGAWLLPNFSIAHSKWHHNQLRAAKRYGKKTTICGTEQFQLLTISCCSKSVVYIIYIYMCMHSTITTPISYRWSLEISVIVKEHIQGLKLITFNTYRIYNIYTYCVYKICI